MVIKAVPYWHKDRHTDQCKRIQNPEIDPRIYGQFIFEKVAKVTWWREDRLLFQQMALKQVHMCMQKIHFDPHTIYKN